MRIRLCSVYKKYYLRYFFCAVLISLPLSASASCKAAATIRLQVLGSGGPEITDGRASSGYLIWQHNKAVVMVDSGSGTALNFEKTNANLNDLQAILFTHFHVDHSVDSPTLIMASYFTNRNKNFKVFGPSGNALMPSATKFVHDLLGKRGAYRYLDDYLLPESESSYKIKVTDVPNVPLVPRAIHHYSLNQHIKLSAVPVQHGPVAAIAWRVDIDGCSITFSGDMNNRYHTLAGLAKNSDLLVASNAIPEGATGVARFLHMPPSEIGKIAAAAQVHKLVLSHRMLRTLGRERETEKEIRRFYSGPLQFANDLQLFSIPQTTKHFSQ